MFHNVEILAVYKVEENNYTLYIKYQDGEVKIYYDLELDFLLDILDS